MLKRIFLFAACAAVLNAHPMGNFSVNHYSRLEVGQNRVSIRYALDLAELPTFELLQQWNLTAASPRAQIEQKAAQQAKIWARHLVIRSGGHALTPRFEGAGVVMSEGAANMQVMRITANFYVPVETGNFEYEDQNYPERAGWKEIVVIPAKDTELKSSTAGAEDRSQGLTVYPEASKQSPPQQLRASVEWNLDRPLREPVVLAQTKQEPVVAPPAAVAPPTASVSTAIAPAPGTVVKGDYLSRMLRDLMQQKDVGFGVILFGIAVAFALGAVHAFSPGHGKTMVAAYLVGSRGNAAHALILGATVTFTHTVSVFLLGLVTLFLSQYILADRLTNILGVISGLTIVWVGGWLLYKRSRRLAQHSHDHGHAHSHDHHHDHEHPHHHDNDHEHHHGPGGHTHVPEGEVTFGSLIALGASGGMVPCPSGLVLLLSAIAIGKTGLGMILLLGFSAGLAVVLTGIGLLVVYAKHLLPDSEKTSQHGAFRLIPVLSAAVILVIGILMTSVSLGWIQPGRLIG